MRVAIFAETYYPFISGVVTHIETLKLGLEAEGHQVLIVTMSPKAEHHYIKDGVLYCPALPLKRIYGYGVANPLNLQRLRIIEEFDPDIIHIHTEFTMGIFGLWAARQLKKPVVYTLHTMYDDYMCYISKREKIQKLAKPGAHMYFRKMAQKATEIIGPSLKVVEYLRRCNVDRHINIIPNTVDLSNFLPENVRENDIDAVRRKLGIQPEDTALCFVGRLGIEKSLDVLFDYFGRQFAGQTKYKLFVIGEGPERKNLEALIERLGLGRQVKLLGKIDHDLLPPYYHACDAFATASLSEINSISMLEAMASGLYVLQRLDIYNKNQITVGVNGALYTNAAEFGALVKEQAALDPAARQQRRRSVTGSTQQYGREEFIAAVVNVYERAMVTYAEKHPQK